MANARVISVFGTKGGVGKTLIAANLAAGLASLLHRKTALIELVPFAHDAVKMLGSSDVRVVSHQLTEASLPPTLAELRVGCSYVLIDAGSVVNQLTATAFESSQLILLITTPDLIALGHMTKALELFEELKIPRRMIKVVLNRAESRGNFRSGEVKEHLPLEILAEIPSDGRLVSLSVNQGRPLVLLPESARIQEALRRLAEALTTTPELFVEHVTVDHGKVPASMQELATLLRKPQESASPLDGLNDPVIALKQRVHSKLIDSFDLKRLDLTALNLNNPVMAKQLRAKTEQLALELVVSEGGFVAGKENREQLVKEIIDEALGMGPLEDLIADETVSDILVNGKDRIYVERSGKLSLTDKQFISNEQLLTVIERIISPLGRRIDESYPMVDARLSDGSRVNAIIHPLSIRGPMLSIRKFSRQRYTMQDLITFRGLSVQMADFLKACVVGRRNILVSGGAGSGKTTLLNVLSAFIPNDERIITIEDAAELRLDQEHWVPLEARPPNIESRGEVTIRQLFRNVLRMRPDRIIIGECRGDETLDMLQAMNTGHDGSLTTVHANSPHHVIARLDSLILMSNVELPIRAIREHIASALDLIVHTARASDGSRRVTHITEVTGTGQHDSEIMLYDVFVFSQRGLGAQDEVLGEFKPTGYVPSFLEELKARGLPLDEAMFHP